MNFRELHTVDCIEVNIKGKGEYFIPRPVFADKKIDSLIIWDGKDDNRNVNVYVSIYSIEKKPLYVDVPANEFAFDNFNNFIGEQLDFDLLKITYTGSDEFTLYCYFSMNERQIPVPEFQRKTLNAKNIKLDIMERVEEIMEAGSIFNLMNIFTANNADFFQNRKIRMISFDKGQKILFSFVTKNGYLRKIPFWWFSQTPVFPYWNMAPFLMNDEIDLDRSSVEFIETIGANTVMNITFFYE